MGILPSSESRDTISHDDRRKSSDRESPIQELLFFLMPCIRAKISGRLQHDYFFYEAVRDIGAVRLLYTSDKSDKCICKAEIII